MTRRRLTSPPPRLSVEPDVPPDLRAAVLASLRWAWARLSEWGVDPATADEKLVTQALARLLNEQDERSRRYARMLRPFGPVERANAEAADGAEKDPDLVFRPKDTRGVRQLTDRGLFVECKRIERGTRHTLGVYCGEEGLRRFEDGRYAPRMRHGLMVGYVRDGRLPYAELSARFKVQPVANEEDVVRTHHERGTLPVPCCDIELTHLWLQAGA